MRLTRYTFMLLCEHLETLLRRRELKETYKFTPVGATLLFTLRRVSGFNRGFLLQRFQPQQAVGQKEKPVYSRGGEDKTRRVTRTHRTVIYRAAGSVNSQHKHIYIATTANGGAATSSSRKHWGPGKSCFAPVLNWLRCFSRKPLCTTSIEVQKKRVGGIATY